MIGRIRFGIVEKHQFARIPVTLPSGETKALGFEESQAIFEHLQQQGYDSAGVERTFAEELEKNEAVKVYAKLPGWFKVPTPLGTYNPDWAVVIDHDGAERVYFVVETKGSLFAGDLRGQEAAKIACGKAHFAAVATSDVPARFIQATKLAGC
jgi:type III restriction enzyme